jgi:hypothetical protein
MASCAALLAGLVSACHGSEKLRSSTAALVAPSLVDLGFGYAGETLTGELLVAAAGAAALTIVAIEPSSPELGADVALPLLLEPGAEQIILLRWTPATAGPLDAWLDLHLAGGAASVRVRLTGLALDVPDCQRPCNDGVFNPTLRACAYTPHEGPCDDGSVCTTGDTCVSGACRGEPISCDDGDACTANLCDPKTGCVFPPDPAYCDDHNACTVDACSMGVCSHETRPDGTPCDLASCTELFLCAAGRCGAYPIEIPGGGCIYVSVDYGDVEVGSTAERSVGVDGKETGLVVGPIDLSTPELSVEPASPVSVAPLSTQAFLLRWQPEQLGPHTGQVVLHTDTAWTWVVTTHGTAIVPSCDDHDPCTRDWYEPGPGWCMNIRDTQACPGKLTAKAVAAGTYDTCVILDNGSVKCWGAWCLGAGGRPTCGDDPGEMSDALPAVSLGSGLYAKAVAVGSSHACAILHDGSVKCWGHNVFGELGLGDTRSRGFGPGQMGDNLPAVDLGAGRRAKALVARENHNCALLDDGSVKCWGEGCYGEGGHMTCGGAPGEMGDNLPAVDLGGGRRARALAA